MRMLQEYSKPENKMKSTSIERFRGQSKTNGQMVQVTPIKKEAAQLSWPQILLDFGALLVIGAFILVGVFALAFLTILF